MAGALSFLTRGALCFSSSIDFSLCFVSIGRIIASESQTGVCATLTPMLFRTQSAAVYGVDADLVDIEVDLTPARGETDQTPAVIIVGLPDLAVRESRERIRAAINNSAFFFPFHFILCDNNPKLAIKHKFGHDPRQRCPQKSNAVRKA